MPAVTGPPINTTYATKKLTTGYPHVGLLEVQTREMWIAKNKLGQDPSRCSHAKLLSAGGGNTANAEKDRFVCFWFHHPDSAPTQALGSAATASMSVHGYPIEWHEAHLLIRLDPTWDIANQCLVKSTDTRKVDRNIDQQYNWGEHIFNTYRELGNKHPLSWHLVGPRAQDSLFYIERCE
ncbi:MAG: hypothetical protein AAGB26_03110 [Planctomycetota bacterium]